MLRYEEICQDFLDIAEGVGLFVYGVRHVVDVITCDREFHCTCVAEESDPPYQIRAEVGFSWEAVLTAESNYSEDYPTYRNIIPMRTGDRVLPESFIELEIRICFDTPNFEDAGILARRIQRLVTNMTPQENQPRIKFEVSIQPEGGVTVHDSYIYYCWQLSFQDEEIQFTPICEGVLQILETLVNSSLFE